MIKIEIEEKGCTHAWKEKDELTIISHKGNLSVVKNEGWYCTFIKLIDITEITVKQIQPEYIQYS